jgi:hypothetical protein
MRSDRFTDLLINCRRGARSSMLNFSVSCDPQGQEIRRFVPACDARTVLP